MNRLTMAQKSIMSMEESFPNDSYNNIGGIIFLNEKIDYKKITKVMNRIFKENDVWKLRICSDKGEYWQYMSQYQEREFKLYDFENNEEAYEKWYEDHIKEKLFKYDEELFRLVFVIHPDGRHGISLLAHHLIQDAYSIVSVFLKQIINGLYDLGCEEVTYSYLSYIDSEKEYLNSSSGFKKSQEFWDNKVKGFYGENVFVGQISADLQGGVLNLNLGNEFTSKINDFCSQYNVSPYNLFMAAVSFYVSHITRNESVVIGTPILNRKTKVEKNTMGMFVNTLPLFVNVQSSLTAIEMLDNIKKGVVEVFRHQRYPYGMIQQGFFDSHGYTMDLLEIILSYQNAKLTKNVDTSLYNIEWVENKRCMNPLSIHIFDHEDNAALNLRYDYQIRKISEKEIVRIHNRLMNIINEIIDKPMEKVENISCIGEEEKNIVLKVFNDTKLDYEKDFCIHQLFRVVAEKNPNKNAVMYMGRSLTYMELDEKSNQLANYLIEIGVQQGDIIGITGAKEIESIIGIVAILKAGASYVPINVRLPKAKQEYIINDCKMKYILTTDIDEMRKIEINNVRAINLKESSVFSQDKNCPIANSSLNDLAYIIYTSGTTGNPKGVMIEHRSVLNLVPMCINGYGMNENDIVLQFANLAFDQAIWDILGTLLIGATICIADEAMLNSMREFERYLNDNKVTVAALTPSLLVELDPEKFDTIRIVESGGEAANPEVLRRWSKKVDLFNAYGPTEATVNTTLWKYTTDTGKVLIGKPLPNVRTYILNKNSICGIGMPGELCIAGDGLARGYLGKDELTDKVFVDYKDPINEKIYRSGDLVKWNEDGNIEYISRIDHQVKIRGFRIELGEIENAIRKKQEIKDVAVIVDEDEGEKYLCVYYELVPGVEISSTEIRDKLLKDLPDYMVPSVYVKMEKFPLTPNGKMNKRLLPKAKKSDYIKGEYLAPRNETEKILVEIFEEVLSVKEIGIRDNFFDLGGHSLKVTKAINQIEARLGVRFSIKEVFENPTVEKIYELIDQEKERNYVAIEKAEDKECYIMSSAQKRLYVINEINDTNTAYNMPIALNVQGELDYLKVQYTFEKLIERHEVLRTSFKMTDGQALQYIAKNVCGKVEYEEHNDLSDEDIKALVDKFIVPFDLSSAPLMRMKIVKLAKDSWILLFDMHHIISDGVSVNILMKDFMDLYNGVELQEIKLQYRDYSEWMKNRDLSSQREYWINEFSGEVPVLELPLDYNRPLEQSFIGNKIEKTIGKDIKEKIYKLCKETNTTEYMVLISSLMILLSKYSAQEDIVVGSPISGRTHKDTENMLGMFVNTLAMRGYVDKEKKYIDFLKEIQGKCLKAYENQEYPFEELVEEVQVNRVMSRNPLFDVLFAMQNTEEVEFSFDGIKFTEIKSNEVINKFDLSIEISGSEQYTITFSYCSELFKQETILTMMDHYISLIEQITKNPSNKINNISFINEEEKSKLLEVFNDTEVKLNEEKTVIDLFEEQVRKTPDRIAVVYKNEKITYKELNERANKVALKLRKLGVKANDFVAIMSTRSIDMIVGIYGIIKSGGAYVPIDPSYPRDRVEYIIEDCKPKAIVISGCNESYKDIPVIDLSDTTIYSEPSANIEKINKPEDLIYVIYTSGTTGKPKGVMIEHRNATNLLISLQEKYPLSENDAYLFKTTYTFDVSVAEIFGWFFCGGRLVVLENEEEKNPESIVKAIEKHNITHINFVPSMLMVFIDYISEMNVGVVNNLKYIFSAGEAITKEIVAKLKYVSNTVSINNLYGPTEATVYATEYFIGEASKDSKIIPIGRPLNNVKTYILDSSNELQPIGVIGELCISGKGVARGYLNREDLNKEKFMDNPFGEGKIYRTGDLARWLPDGNIECIGRIDDQVKVRGYRIELGEIESVLMKQDSVQNAVVIVREKNGYSALCAYVVSDKEIDMEILKDGLRKELPEYMIPSYLIQIESIPLNNSGKADKKALPDIEVERKVEYKAPSNKEEEVLIQVFENVLAVENIGANDSFFELGGDSIKAIRIVSKLRELGYILNVKDLMQGHVVKSIATKMKNSEESLKYNQGEVTGIVPMTPIQRDFFELKLPKPNHYNQALVFEAIDGLDENILKETFKAIVTHHDVLRSVFNNGEQRILSTDECKMFDMKVIDLKGLSSKDDIAEVIKHESEILQSNIDLAVGPLMKIALFKGQEKDYLMICIHHLVVDGVSWRILIEDFESGYMQYSKDKTIKLTDKTASYKEWAEALVEYSRKKAVIDEVSYWKEISERINRSQLSKKHNDVFNEELIQTSIVLDEDNTTKLLYNSGAAYSTEIIDLLLAALAMSIEKWKGIKEVGVDLEGHGREEIGTAISIDRTVGWFTSKYPIVITAFDDLDKNIINTKESIRKVPNHGVGYGIIKYLNNEPMDYAKTDICFNYLGHIDNEVNKDATIRISNLSAGVDSAKDNGNYYNLSFDGGITKERLELNITYNKAVFDKGSIENLKSIYKEALIEIIEFCCNKKEIVKTASDFDEELTNDVLEELFDIFD